MTGAQRAWRGGTAGAARSRRPHELGLGRTITSGTVWSGIGRFGVLGFGLVGQILTARVLAPRAFGSYTLILSVAGLVALVAQLGLPQSTVRHIALSNAAPEGSQARAAICGSAALAAVVATAAGALAWWPLGGLLDRVFPDTGLAAVLGLFAALVGVRILENVAPELFRGVRDFSGGSIFGGLLAAVLLAAFTALVLTSAGTASLQTALAISVVASVSSLVGAAVILWRKLRSLPRVPRTRPVDLGALSPTIWCATIFNYAISQLDLWVVGALGGGGQRALYSAAFRLATLVTVPLTIVNFVVSPLVVELLARGQRNRLRLAIQTVTTLAGVPALAVLAVFVVFGSWICARVYGPFYAGAGIPLALLAIGKLASVLTGPCGITLLMSGKQRIYLKTLAVNIALTLPLQLAGFRFGGMAGLAAATSAGFAVQNLHQMIAVRRHTGVSTHLDIAQTVRLVLDTYRRDKIRP